MLTKLGRFSTLGCDLLSSYHKFFRGGFGFGFSYTIFNNYQLGVKEETIMNRYVLTIGIATLLLFASCAAVVASAWL